MILGAYLLIVPSINLGANDLLNKCENQAGRLKKMAERAEQPDAIKTRKHLDCAKEYDETLSTQLKDLHDLLATKLKLEQRFKDAPNTGSEFDIWLENLRKSMLAKAQQANLKISVPTDKLLFEDERTSDTASKSSLHRDYRLKHMAITQEIWDILCTKWVRQTAPMFTTEVVSVEKQTNLELGALELEKIIIGAARDSADPPTWLFDAYNRAKGLRSSTTLTSKNAPSIVDLPYTCTPIDIQFVAPFSVVSHVLKALENSDRYLAVITRLDYQRATIPYPSASEKGLEIAGHNPTLNTYYLEGPVRVLVTMELYEYDKSKEDNLKKLAGIK
ncbi:MAG: hypothetical protein V1899_04710 [Planctomycetota bacterium]